ncbi:hypothetical protein DXG03_002802 [Asterophora parasitica]|uniref:Homeobox domain-containing protein n=1 Tax=Asterophora parasitica TaxID=117018 RepID=A0A9P7G2I9_9AGAR|nr:hypothetical protein DXG03_002802 [Asterophora parasitica]
MSLAGLQVIEFAGLAPGPFAGLILADNGASVIRVDKPGSVSTDVLCRGKRSIAINPKIPSGLETLKKLLSYADVVIDPFRPAVMERLGLGPEVFLGDGGLNPKLIYARIVGFPRTGPQKDMAGHDINYLALSGTLAMLPGAEKPTFPLNLLADFAGGGLMCALGILLALIERGKSGRGQVVNADMVSGASYIAAFPLLHSLIPASPLFGNERGNNVLDGGAPFYDIYTCKDGQYMSVGCLEPQFFRVFIAVFISALPKGFNSSNGWRPSPQTQTDRTEWPKLRDFLTQGFKSNTRDYWAQVFQALLLKGTDACALPVLTPQEARSSASPELPFPPTHPQISSLSSKRSSDPHVYHISPGEHTWEILEELKLSENEKRRLVANGALGEKTLEIFQRLGWTNKDSVDWNFSTCGFLHFCQNFGFALGFDWRHDTHIPSQRPLYFFDELLRTTMVKKTARATANSAPATHTQHTSTSETVKTRPRKRPRLDGNPILKAEPTERALPDSDQLLSLAPEHLDELMIIWDSDRRTPSVPSRRAWALARGVRPECVHRWFARRKQIAKRKKQKTGALAGTYELEVGTPPVLQVKVKMEATPVDDIRRNTGRRGKNLESDERGAGPSSDAPSSDRTLVACSSPREKHYLRSSSPLRYLQLLPPSSSPPPLSSLPPSPSPVPTPVVTELLSLPALPLFEPPAPSNEAWCAGPQGQTAYLAPDMLTFFACALCRYSTASVGPCDSTPAHYASTRTNQCDDEHVHEDTDANAHKPQNVHEAQMDSDYAYMELSALSYLMRSPDLIRKQEQSESEQARHQIWCLDGRLYAQDGTFVGACSRVYACQCGGGKCTSWGLDREVSPWIL